MTPLGNKRFKKYLGKTRVKFVLSSFVFSDKQDVCICGFDTDVCPSLW